MTAFNAASVLFRVQNIHDYVLKYGAAQKWDDLKSFVCSRPPYPHIVFSYDSVGIASIIHFDVVLNEILPEKIIEWLSRVDETKGGNHRGTGETWALIDRLKPYRILVLAFYAEGRDTGLMTFVFIDEQGRVLADSEDTAYVMLIQENRWKEPNDDKLLKKLSTVGVSVALASINFMNCKNTEIVDNPPSRQVRRQCERQGKRPPVTYKTLVVHPIGKRRMKVLGNLLNLQMPLHICRGHFKDYRNGTGLGKFHRHGIWWWSPQVRGTIEAGRVVKDYQVESEEAIRA